MTKRYAILEGTVVVNTSTGHSPLQSNWIESNTAQRGDLYDGSVFSKPSATASQLKDMMKSRLDSRVIDEIARDFSIGGVVTSIEELKSYEDLMKGESDTWLNLASGPVRITAAQQGAVRNIVQTRLRAIRKREHDIIVDVTGTSGGIVAKIARFKTIINADWPEV